MCRGCASAFVFAIKDPSFTKCLYAFDIHTASEWRVFGYVVGIFKNCSVCNKQIIVKPSLYERKKYCSRKCALIGWKGQHRSPDTQFKKGRKSNRILLIDSITFRSRKRENGKIRAWIKVADPNVWELRAKIIWVTHNGEIPKGMLIHHKDRNTLNDDISNLELISRGDHLMEHRPEFEDKRKRRASRSNRKRWAEYRLSQYDKNYWE